MLDRLAFCRLCGGNPKLTNTVNTNRVKCDKCGFTVNQTDLGVGNAALRWNTLMEDRMNIKRNTYYRLGGQVGDIVGSHVLEEMREVFWDSIEQQWVER